MPFYDDDDYGDDFEDGYVDDGDWSADETGDDDYFPADDDDDDAAPGQADDAPNGDNTEASPEPEVSDGHQQSRKPEDGPADPKEAGSSIKHDEGQDAQGKGYRDDRKDYTITRSETSQKVFQNVHRSTLPIASC